MSDGKYAPQSGFGPMVRRSERSRERAAARDDGSAGGLLGYQYVSFTFPNIAANGSTVQATGSATSGASGGTPGVSQSSGTITYCTDNVASYYLLIVRVNWSGLTGGAATDIFKVEWNDWLTTFVSVATAIANGFPGPSMSGGGPISSSGGMQPELVVTCPSGAGRTLTGVTLQYEILRFAV